MRRSTIKRFLSNVKYYSTLCVYMYREDVVFMTRLSKLDKWEITKAYRKTALKYHPDKNPDDEIAARLFQQLTKAYEILCNPIKKEEYDLKIRALLEHRKRLEKMDALRRKTKEDLEKREIIAKMQQADAINYQQNTVDRLREETRQMQEDFLRKAKEKEFLTERELLKQTNPPFDQKSDFESSILARMRSKKKE